MSREPLLPIGAGPPKSGTTALPSIVTQTGPYGRSDSNVSAGARMRGSFDKLFKRGFSFERSPTTPANAGPSSAFPSIQTRSAEVSPITFELNVGGMGGIGADRSPTSPGHRKHSLSPLQGSSTSLAHASFVAAPPAHMDPPLRAVPVVDERTGRAVRNYELHPSRNRFFLGGRVLTGGDSPWAFIASLVLVLTIAGVFFGTTCVWWWTHESPAVAAVGAYMCLLTISSMLATVSCRSVRPPVRPRQCLRVRVCVRWRARPSCLSGRVAVRPLTGCCGAHGTAADGARAPVTNSFLDVPLQAFRDPGILPRNLDPDPPYPDTQSEASLRAPLPRDLKVRAGR